MGINTARVNALITEANRAIRQEHSRIAPEQQPRTDRAGRLRDLELQPPRWLVKAIGRAPGKTQNTGALLAWRRAALAITALWRGVAVSAYCPRDPCHPFANAEPVDLQRRSLRQLERSPGEHVRHGPRSSAC